jgi:ribosome-binding protein aMBF1 (putative translation factor)
MVTGYKGKFYPAGLQNFLLEDYWDILENGRLDSGWSSSLLAELSEVIDAG